MVEAIIPLIIFGFVVIIMLAVLLNFIPINLWYQAKVNGLNVNLGQLLAMKIRKVNPNVIVKNAILLHKAGINIPLDLLEAHYLAGGKLINVANALIEAQKAGINSINYKLLTAIDLAGNNPVDTIKDIIIPKESESGDFICKTTDGKQYKVSFKATTRLSREKISLYSSHIVEILKRYIEDYIYELDTSTDIDATTLRDSILETDFEEDDGFLVLDIKVYIQRA